MTQVELAITMKNIVLPIHDDAGQEARLRCALDIVRAVGGRLHCLGISLVPMPADSSFDGVGGAILLQNACTREKTNRIGIERRLESEDVPWSWVDMTGPFADCVEDAALLADLIVLSCTFDESPYADLRGTTAEIISRTGKPIFAVPDDVRKFAADGHALVAWDGSARAAAVLQAAVPLLRHARKVTLLEIDDGSIGMPAKVAAEYLFLHGIHARLMRDYALAQPVGEILLADVAARHADYVVMGAYGHSRAVEAVFGGVTRFMLNRTDVPVLMVH
jgi:nucleotide-binding universal stress UspA family protein